MKITLENIGKKFNKEWIFRDVNCEFSMGNNYAILGTNGSGKSTLLQIIAGAVSASEGRTTYSLIPRFSGSFSAEAGERRIGDLELFSKLALAAPYLELPEEMTWREAVKFHSKFKPFAPLLKGAEEIISVSGLSASSNKEIRNFSSGMKQRARLALAILSDTPLLLLDEPSTNLDREAVKWYQNLLSEFAKEKLVIIFSNYNPEEYSSGSREFVLAELQQGGIFFLR